MEKSIDLTCTEYNDTEKAIRVLEHCVIQMGAGFFNKVLLFYKSELPKPTMPTGMESIPIGFTSGSRHLYSVWRLREQVRYVASAQYLNIHTDGFIVNPNKWRESWREYDYIGAPWPFWRIGGNGSFCLRSRELMRWVSQHPEPLPHGDNEDVWICRNLSKEIVDAGFKFAPLEVCEAFSLELDLDDRPKRTLKDTFGFHGVARLAQLAFP